MISRILEHLIIGAFNRRADRKAAQTMPNAAQPDTAPEEDIAVIGKAILATRNPQTVRLSFKTRLRHVYILGATGCGKTNLTMRLIDSDLRQQRPICVFDLRGDLIDRILLRIAAQGDVEEWKGRLLVLDLRDSEAFVGVNPLAGDGDTYSRAMHLLSVLQAQSESWGVQLEETLRNCLLALAETGWTPLEIGPLLMDAPWRAQVMRGVKDSQVREFFTRYDKLSQASQLTWTQTALNKVSPLLSVPALRYTFGQRQPLQFRELIEKQKGMVILVSLGVDRFHDAARLAGGLLVSCFQSAIMSRSDVPESQRRPVNLYIDEFEAMASDRFETIVCEGWRLGLGLTLSHQNLSQLPTNLRSVILNNAHTQFYFQTGAKDAAELAREIGSAIPAEETRSALLSQQVGQAFLVRRGQPSLQLQVEHSPDPSVSQEQVERLKAIARESYARPREQLDAELEERQRQRQSNTSVPADAGRSVEDVGRPIYEIRHSNTKTFAPKPKGESKPKGASKPKGESQPKSESQVQDSLEPKGESQKLTQAINPSQGGEKDKA